MHCFHRPSLLIIYRDFTSRRIQNLQDNLLLYNHARLSSMEDGHSNAGSKDYLVSLMFSHYDLNNNGLLEAQELSKVGTIFFLHPHFFFFSRPFAVIENKKKCIYIFIFDLVF